MPNTATPSVREDKRNGQLYTVIRRKYYYLGARGEYAAALTRLAELLKQARVGADPLTIAGASEEWLNINGHKTNRRTSIARLLDHVGAHQLRQPCKKTLWKDFYARLEADGCGAWYCRKIVYICHQFLTWCSETYDNVPAPPRPHRMPNPAGDPKGARPKDVTAFLEALSRRRGRAKYVLQFAAMTGCRPIEARLLRWEEVHFDDDGSGLVKMKKHKTSAKTDKMRIICFNTEAGNVLRAQGQKSKGWVFESAAKPGKPMSHHALWGVTHRTDAAFFPYRLRHSVAQQVLDQTKSKEAVAFVLGHADLRMADVYAETSGMHVKHWSNAVTLPWHVPVPAAPGAPAGTGQPRAAE